MNWLAGGRDRVREREELAGSAGGERHDEGTRSNTLRLVGEVMVPQWSHSGSRCCARKQGNSGRPICRAFACGVRRRRDI